MNSPIAKILLPLDLEYLVVDCHFSIQETSSGVQRFADRPEDIAPGIDLRQGFPELIGIESILHQVARGEKSAFKIKGIARGSAENPRLYFDLSALQYPGNPGEESNQLLIVCTQTSEAMQLKQELLQRANEANLLLSTLAAAKSYTDRIITSMGDALFVTNRAGTIKTVNQAAQDLFQYSESELIGQPISAIIKDENSVEKSHYMGKELEADGWQTLEGICRTKSGEEILVSFSRSAIQTDLKDYQDFVYVGRDMTERQRATAELERARREAELASQAKSNFLANMSHEIRTPMNAVLGMTGLLLQTPLTPEQRDFVETIRLSGDALLTLINEILDLSKLEAGEMQLEELPFDLASCVEDVVDLLAPQAHAKQLEISSFIERNTPIYLIGDAARLRQVLTNLMGNAIKFTREGYVTVQVELLESTDPGATIAFSIVDTGIGIEPENQKKLFQPFSQVDASTTRQYGGTGLGLAICRQIVNLMQGEIGVESEAGKGSKFWFKIPFRRQKEAPERVAPPERLKGRSLLAIGDRPLVRFCVRDRAEAWGMQVDETESATGIQWLQKQRERGKFYQVVAIDLGTEAIAALALGEMIRSHREFGNLPLIAIAATNQRSKVKEALKMGFADYVIKPMKPARFLDTLSRVFGIESKSNQTLGDRHLDLHSTAEKFPLKLLVVEDNLVNQKTIVKQLELLGYGAEVVNHGQEAIARWKTNAYDIILMDCQMPILDGYQTTREIRRLEGGDRASTPEPQRRHTIVIAMTANAMKEDREKCLAAGMDDYLSKPVHQEQLQAILTQWGSKLSESPAAATVNPPPMESGERPFDLDRLELICAGDAAFKQEVLETFIAEIQAHLAALQAVPVEDFATVEQEAHYIKGASGNIGAKKLYGLAALLEREAKQGKGENSAALLAQLTEAFQSVVSFVGQVVQRE